MEKLFSKINDIREAVDLLVKRPYGMIQARAGQLEFVQLRPFPKLISVAEATWMGGWAHRRVPRDRVRLYYNQPMGHANYLAAKYAVSELGTTLATIRAAHRTLDEIARIKGSDAILCEVTTRRITDRIASYWGFEPHCPNKRGRHFIRRFYGDYPPHTDWVDASKPLAST